MNSLREDATRLRDLGYSYNMIKEELGVSISTQSNWFSLRPYTPNEEVAKRIKSGPMKNGISRHKERIENTKRTIAEAENEISDISKRDLWMLGIGLYMGEGSKSIESVRIINSDPDIIRLSLRWFREACQLNDDNFALSLHLYPENVESEAIKYWCGVTGLSDTSFKASHVDRREDKKRKMSGKLPHGTLQIRIKANGNSKNGVELFRKIKGWTKGVFNQV